ncbi:MAG: hypothetical protein ACYDHX_06350 [Methanothrix sp.]
MLAKSDVSAARTAAFRAACLAICRKDGRALELQTAKEILAEVFSIQISEVDEMIANRFL